MARFFGAVGYAVKVEQRPGVWIDQIVEHNHYGDVIRNTRRWQEGADLNDDLKLSNSISIVADLFADENFHNIKYVKWKGGVWKVTTIEINPPRLILQLGGVYNGEQAETP